MYVFQLVKKSDIFDKHNSTRDSEMPSLIEWFFLLHREQEQEEILRARLGRRDSAAQITTISPPTEVSAYANWSS